MEKINMANPFSGEIRFDEPMARHTSFRVGGPADCWVRPGGEFPAYAPRLLAEARREDIPVFILGGGANLLVGDRGIRGIVLDTGRWAGFSPENSRENGGECIVRVCSGSSVDEITAAAAEKSLGGLEFLAGMPGSVGGAVWMNARCYEKEVADVLVETEFLDESLEHRVLGRHPGDFSYKKSPFQGAFTLILSAKFRLRPRLQEEILREMAEHRLDREDKGHYRHPSAGSAFKNNRSFGRSTGKIIDELGLRGLQVGGAAVAPYHGNIIINNGGAKAEDIRRLIDLVREKVKNTLGFDLEPEIIFAGEWP
ncbi:UDP-N-acetylenolpyruvoylglucosamine reductase [Spirochaetia bacterium]|nr:UDP-N-acetylenolpyruvoylglucosamine reductase [Spirochaetia bacterium]